MKKLEGVGDFRLNASDSVIQPAQYKNRLAEEITIVPHRIQHTMISEECYEDSRALFNGQM